MKSKTTGNLIAFGILIVVAVLALTVKKCSLNNGQQVSESYSPAKEGWRNHRLVYTKHARCRMECREISEEEVEYILENGIINEAKSREADGEAKGKCPTYALEGKTDDGQQVRIVFGACDKITKVVTAIDINKEYTCNCR
jgi:hypothetical protein